MKKVLLIAIIGMFLMVSCQSSVSTSDKNDSLKKDTITNVVDTVKTVPTK
jgi:hypothetical protein